MSKKKHIIIISSWYPSYYSQNGVFVKEQAEALARYGHKVSVFHYQYISFWKWMLSFFFKSGKNRWQKSSYIRTVEWKCFNFIPSSIFKDSSKKQKSSILLWARIYFFFYKIFQGRPNLIHQHGTLNYTFITKNLSCRFKIPYVFTEHSPLISKSNLIPLFHDYETNEEVMRFVGNAVKRIAVNDSFQKKCEKVYSCSFKVVPNMVSQVFLDTELVTGHKNKQSFFFINVGHFIPRKNHITLLEAFSLAFKNDSNVQLYLIGLGKRGITKKIVSKIDELKLNEKVFLLGNLNRKELIEVLDRSHVSVISSNAESFGMVAVEAMSRGLPVVSTICGGPEDFIKKENGVLCRADDVDDLAEKMRSVYENYSKYNSEEILQYVIDKYSEKRIVKELDHIYDEVVAKT